MAEVSSVKTAPAVAPTAGTTPPIEAKAPVAAPQGETASAGPAKGTPTDAQAKKLDLIG